MMMYPVQFVSTQLCEMTHTLPIPPLDGLRLADTVVDPSQLHQPPQTMQIDFTPPVRAKTKQSKKVKPIQTAEGLKMTLPEEQSTSKMIYECDLCKKIFSSQSSLWKHEKTHTGERPYSCTMCKKAFTQLANLQRHYYVHNGLKPFKCPFCDRPFSQQANMVKHQMLHTGEKPYKCETCDKSFSQRANLKKHEMIHTGERPHECPLCGKPYAQFANMKKHLLTHDKPKGKKLQCQLCIKQFRSAEEYKEHSRLCDASILEDEFGNRIQFEVRNDVKSEKTERD